MIKKIWNKVLNKNLFPLARALWLMNGSPVPQPHGSKVFYLRRLMSKNNFDVVVETGTFLGDMVDALRKKCSVFHTIELSEELYKRAQKKYKNTDNVVLHQGDSGKILGDVIKDIHSPILFWLDGHWSDGITAKGDKDTPIVAEIEHAALHPLKDDHLILIDDARCFDGKNDYPTEENLKKYCADKGFNWFVRKDDIFFVSAKEKII